MQGFLKDTFRDHTPEPPRDLWAGIEGELRPRKRFAWLPYASAIAAMLVVVVGLMWILASDEVARKQLGTPAPTPMADAAVVPAIPQPAPAPVPAGTVPAPATRDAAVPGKHVAPATPVSPLPVVTPALAEAPRSPLPVIMPVTGKPAVTLPAGKPGQIAVHPVEQPVFAAAGVPSGSQARKQEYDLSKVSMDDVLLFAARSLGRVADLPFAVYADNNNPQRVKAYQVQLGENFSIERKRATP